MIKKKYFANTVEQKGFFLSEYIDQKNLLKYFDRKKIDYYDFSKAACTLKNVGVLNEK